MVQYTQLMSQAVIVSKDNLMAAWDLEDLSEYLTI
jgi:hypothetical protein